MNDITATMSDLLGRTMSNELLAEFQRAWERAPQTKYNPALGEAIEDMVYSVTGYCPPIHYLVQDYIYGWEEERYESGALQSRIHTVFGVRDGEGREWYENGQLKSLGTYVNGLLEGTFLTWHEDGTPWIICPYVTGKKHGCEQTYENNILTRETMYSHGTRHGPLQVWFDNYRRNVWNYENDILHGIQQYYHYENGQVTTEITFHEGTAHGPYRTWHENGQLWCEGNHAHDRKHGKWIYRDSIQYYENGEMVREELIPFV